MTLIRSCLAAGVLLLIAACGGDPAPAADPPPAVEATAPAPVETPAPVAAAAPLSGDPAAGKEVYSTTCLACHQADGTGMGGALGADFVNDATRRAKTDEQLLESIKKGVEGTTMVAWEPLLSETQRKDVLAYIRVTYMGHGG
jgi:mono/diheme cytochrome c family protein